MIEALFRQAVASIDLASRVERAVRRLALPRTVRVIAAGKCAPAMAEGALAAIRPAEPPLVVTVRGLSASMPVLRAGHPLPDRASVCAGREALAMARRARPGSALLVLISGGASSLLCAPVAGIDLAVKRRVTAALLAGGAPIAEINHVRALLSDVKGGKLALAAAGARVVTLVASDVLGPGDLARVGSGPTLGRLAPRREGIRVAGPRDLLRAAEREAWRAGLEVHRLPWAEGSVEELADRYAALTEPGLHVAVGEPTIRITGPAGEGGRSQHLALLVARRIRGRAARFLAAGSDGTDGNSAAAGAIVDGGTWRRAARAGLSPGSSLARFDSGRLHTGLGTAVVTGPTGLNLLDLHMVLVDRSLQEGV